MSLGWIGGCFGDARLLMRLLRWVRGNDLRLLRRLRGDGDVRSGVGGRPASHSPCCLFFYTLN